MLNMNKRKLHHVYTKTKWIKSWYFLVLALIFSAICVIALRANNEHMVELRDAVYAADKNNTDVQAPLRELQAYVTTHMNTDLSTGKGSVYPPIQLKYTYERLVKAQGDAVAAANAKLYTDAQAYCEQQNSGDFSGRNRVPCIEQYIQTHDASIQQIPQDLYKFSFTTPSWSPDLAGWTKLLAIASGLMFVVAFIARKLFK